MPKASRVEVYAALDSERKYQEDKRGNAAGGPLVTEGDFIAAIGAYLQEINNSYRTNDHAGYLADLRKIGGLVVQGMEKLGAPLREEEQEKPKLTAKEAVSTVAALGAEVVKDAIAPLTGSKA